MTQIKQTDTKMIRAYGLFGKEKFDEIEALLVDLGERCAQCDYEGEKSTQFKKDCVEFANSFAIASTDVMKAITAAINFDAGFITNELGGSAVDLEAPKEPVVAPAIPPYGGKERINGDDIVLVRDESLSMLDKVSAAFTDNLDEFIKLGKDGWIGTEYDEARAKVNKLTNEAVGVCNETKTGLTNRVNQQLQTLGLSIG